MDGGLSGNPCRALQSIKGLLALVSVKHQGFCDHAVWLDPGLLDWEVVLDLCLLGQDGEPLELLSQVGCSGRSFQFCLTGWLGSSDPA